MLLLAAVETTGLLPTLTPALADPPVPVPWLQRLLAATLRALLLTLLFLAVAGLRRPWDLRAYTGDALGLLTARPRAYGYRTVERFLGLLARAGVADRLTSALARWTAAVWLPHPDPAAPTIVYIDGHHKPIHTDARIPRGLIGRTGKILGCRALTLLHDADGHVLLAQTARGDQHLTAGAPAILSAYEAANPHLRLATTVIDREGMSAAWLAQLVAEGRTVVTLLRRDQYTDLASFTEVGVFTPLVVDAAGQVCREVAPARFLLPMPGQAAGLPLWVALIRDHTWRDPVADLAPHPTRWDADLRGPAGRWWEPGWQAPPAPPVPTQPQAMPWPWRRCIPAAGPVRKM